MNFKLRAIFAMDDPIAQLIIHTQFGPYRWKFHRPYNLRHAHALPTFRGRSFPSSGRFRLRLRRGQFERLRARGHFPQFHVKVHIVTVKTFC